MRHYAFPEIGQYRQAIRNVKTKTQTIGVDAAGDNIYDGSLPLPKIKYRGTVKLHGTNSAIAKDLITGEYQFQSRENVVTVEKDNYGFARFLTETATACGHLFPETLFTLIPNVEIPPAADASDEEKNAIIIYGEWCGGNIQKNVALTGLPKMFVVFSVRYKGAWLPEEYLKLVKLPEYQIFNILDYPTFEMEIDFNYPEIVQNNLVEITLAVEKECPFSKLFGVSGIGEGVVWRPIDLATYKESSFWFKVKGKEHSETKTKQLASVDTEKMNSIREFIESVVTENRLQHGCQMLRMEKNAELDKSAIGDLIRWVFDDVKKEESDTIKASGLQEKEIGQALAKKTRDWFFKNCA